jgi:genome maintenance exonuclease 1
MEGRDERLFSITNVLSKTISNDGLIKWRQRVGNEKANQITKAATTRGIAVHGYCEDYLLNKQIVVPEDSYENSNFNMFLQMKNVLDQQIDNIHGVEIPLYSQRLLIAGTPDCIAEYDGKLSIIDFKTAKNKSKIIVDKLKKYLLQCTAYSEMVKDLYDIEINNCVILFALENGEIQVLSLPITDLERSALAKLCAKFRTLI